MKVIHKYINFTRVNTKAYSTNTKQKGDLTDTFGRKHNYLRISITERCNLRCTYCMPEEGVDLQSNDKLLTTPEIIRLANLFVKSGVDKIRLTGGEPTVRKDIIELTEALGALKGIKTLAMTSNGIVLSRKLPKLAAAGLNMVNISLDTLDPMKFTLITRRLGWENVMKTIDTALELGIPFVKVNCVVMRNVNDEELSSFVEMTRKKPIQVRFIEYMPFDGNTWSNKMFMPYNEMIEKLAKNGYPLIKLNELKNETSKMYKVDGFEGQVGFITSMSEHFCGTCNRLRLMADGSLKVCLFGQTEISLRDKLRSGATEQELLDLINMAILRKKFSHDGMEQIDKQKHNNRPMILIGG